MTAAGELRRKRLDTEGISDVLAEILRKSQVNKPYLDETLESLRALAALGTEGAIFVDVLRERKETLRLYDRAKAASFALSFLISYSRRSYE